MHNGCTNRIDHGFFLMPILIKEYIKRILAPSSWHCPLELFKPPCHNSCDTRLHRPLGIPRKIAYITLLCNKQLITFGNNKMCYYYIPPNAI